MSELPVEPGEPDERLEFLPVLEALDRIIHSPARLMILTFLYVVDGGDMVYLIHQTGLTWGNLSVNVQKLEEAGYVSVEKRFVERRPQTWVKLTETGRQAFRAYRSQLKGVLDDLPE
jgi:DNA-binding MarR family transcriptional regulator